MENADTGPLPNLPWTGWQDPVGQEGADFPSPGNLRIFEGPTSLFISGSRSSLQTRPQTLSFWSCAPQLETTLLPKAAALFVGSALGKIFEAPK